MKVAITIIEKEIRGGSTSRRTDLENVLVEGGLLPPPEPFWKPQLDWQHVGRQTDEVTYQAMVSMDQYAALIESGRIVVEETERALVNLAIGGDATAKAVLSDWLEEKGVRVGRFGIAVETE